MRDITIDHWGWVNVLLNSNLNEKKSITYFGISFATIVEFFNKHNYFGKITQLT